ncbi:hypothetical protein TYRP_013071 [Tyrophagus putrescentiae]|nr:hypothetical protein TYRP_013071 [Tyrophagus putrescentiae]
MIFSARSARLAAVHLAMRLLRPTPTNLPTLNTSTETRILRPEVISVGIPDGVQAHARVEENGPGHRLEDVAQRLRHLNVLQVFRLIFADKELPVDAAALARILLLPHLSFYLILIDILCSSRRLSGLLLLLQPVGIAEVKLLDKAVDDAKQLVAELHQVLVEAVLDGEAGEEGVVHQGGAQVGERARRVAARVLVEVARDEVVEDGVAEKLQPLVAVGDRVLVVAVVREGLHQVGLVLEGVANGLLKLVQAVLLVNGVQLGAQLLFGSSDGLLGHNQRRLGHRQPLVVGVAAKGGDGIGEARQRPKLLRHHLQPQPVHKLNRPLRAAADEVGANQSLHAVGNRLVGDGVLRQQIVRHLVLVHLSSDIFRLLQDAIARRAPVVVGLKLGGNHQLAQLNALSQAVQVNVGDLSTAQKAQLALIQVGAHAEEEGGDGSLEVDAVTGVAHGDRLQNQARIRPQAESTGGPLWVAAGCGTAVKAKLGLFFPARLVIVSGSSVGQQLAKLDLISAGAVQPIVGHQRPRVLLQVLLVELLNLLERIRRHLIGTEAVLVKLAGKHVEEADILACQCDVLQLAVHRLHHVLRRPRAADVDLPVVKWAHLQLLHHLLCGQCDLERKKKCTLGKVDSLVDLSVSRAILPIDIEQLTAVATEHPRRLTLPFKGLTVVEEFVAENVVDEALRLDFACLVAAGGGALCIGAFAFSLISARKSSSSQICRFSRSLERPSRLSVNLPTSAVMLVVSSSLCTEAPSQGTVQSVTVSTAKMLQKVPSSLSFSSSSSSSSSSERWSNCVGEPIRMGRSSGFPSASTSMMAGSSILAFSLAFASAWFRSSISSGSVSPKPSGMAVDGSVLLPKEMISISVVGALSSSGCVADTSAAKEFQSPIPEKGSSSRRSSGHRLKARLGELHLVGNSSSSTTIRWRRW